MPSRHTGDGMIPAPLLSRHTAIAVVVAVALVVAAAVAAAFGSVPVLFPLAVAVFAVVQALALFLVWRTLAPRRWAIAGTALLAMGGFLLLALTELVTFVPVIPELLVQVARVVVAVALFIGLIGLGVAVLRHRAWTGPTSATLLVAGVLVAALVVAGLVGIPRELPTAAWALVLLGLAAGLRTPRVVPDVGVPDTQVGAAKV